MALGTFRQLPVCPCDTVEHVPINFICAIPFLSRVVYPHRHPVRHLSLPIKWLTSVNALMGQIVNDIIIIVMYCACPQIQAAFDDKGRRSFLDCLPLQWVQFTV